MPSFSSPLRRPLLPAPWRALLPAITAGGALLWAYAPTLTALAERWGQDANYSHGYLVPLFALFLLWSRRAQLAGLTSWRPNGWGAAILSAGLGLTATGTYLYLDWLNG